MSCDPDVQYKIVLILQSDWTRLYAGTLHKLIYATFPDSLSLQRARSLGTRLTVVLFAQVVSKYPPAWGGLLHIHHVRTIQGIRIQKSQTRLLVPSLLVDKSVRGMCVNQSNERIHMYKQCTLIVRSKARDKLERALTNSQRRTRFLSRQEKYTYCV